MADVNAFRGLRFNPEKIENYDAVITPPFDVIDPSTREELAQKSPYNMVHLTLPKEQGSLSPYEVAAKEMESRISEGIFIQDDERGFYLLEQIFTGLDGVEHRRRGFFAVARIPEDDDPYTVLGHERTFLSKVQDRLALTEATKANLGAVFVIYDDAENQLAPFLAQMDERNPDIETTTIEGVRQRIWRVPNDVRVEEFFLNRSLYIADGHHRYRTAVEYRNRRRAEEKMPGNHPYDYVLMGFVSMTDPGLVVWPTHRLLDPPDGFDAQAFLKRLEDWFEVTPCEGDLAQQVTDHPSCAFGLAIHGVGRYLLVLRDIDRAAILGEDADPVWRDLDVALLHKGIFGDILGIPEGAEFVYEPNHNKALEQVDLGTKGLAFLLKAIPPEQVRDCADAGVFMPEKATYFFPKLPTGGVIHRLEE